MTAATPKARRTQTRIIDAALELFNTQGVANVGLRDIATACEMTQGNLTYHFPNKGQLLAAIFSQAAELVGEQLASVSEVSLASIDSLWMRGAQMQRRYRFFYVDLVEIDRQYPEVAKQHERNALLRRRQLEELLNTAVARGLVRDEQHEGDYARLAHAAWLVLTFWVSERAAFSQRPSTPKAWARDFERIRSVLWTLLRPHLTPQGRRALDALGVFASV